MVQECCFKWNSQWGTDKLQTGTQWDIDELQDCGEGEGVRGCVMWSGTEYIKAFQKILLGTWLNSEDLNLALI